MESLHGDGPLELSSMSARAKACALSSFCKIGALRRHPETKSVVPHFFTPLHNAFSACFTPLLSTSLFTSWMLGSPERINSQYFRPNQPSRKIIAPPPLLLALSFLDQCQWKKAGDQALPQILHGATTERSGLAAALLCAFGARPDGFWTAELAPLCKADSAINKALSQSSLACAGLAGRRLMSGQVQAGSSNIGSQWKTDWPQAKAEAAEFGHLLFGCFAERSAHAASWLGKSREADPKATSAMLALARACSDSGNLAWDAAASNDPAACLGFCLWGADPDAPGPDELRPVDIATRKGRALLYRSLALAGADCASKGKGSRKSPAELGRKLLRTDLGAELLCMAERAELQGALSESPASFPEPEAPATAPTRRNRL